MAVMYGVVTGAGNNLTGVAVQFATQDRENAIQVSKCIAVFAMRNAIYSMPNSSKRRFSAMQNFESKLFPVLEPI